MIVEKRHVNGFTLLNVEGVIKLGESAQFFAQTLERALADDRGHVIVDFSKINFIDSTGIGELVGPSRQEEVLAAIRAGLAPYRTPEGGYRLENEYHYVIARA